MEVNSEGMKSLDIQDSTSSGLGERVKVGYFGIRESNYKSIKNHLIRFVFLI